jgi:ankyrin repeat protein
MSHKGRKHRFSSITIHIGLLVIIPFVLISCGGKKAQITGEVLDGFGAPLKDVLVSVKGTTFKATTDAKGKYSVGYAGNLNSDLLTAAKQGDTNQVKDLLDRGADVNAKHKGGQTALMYATFKGHTDTIKILLDRGADVNAKHKGGQTALMYAVIKGHTDTIKILLDKGADVNAKDMYGDTALMEATFKGHTDTIKILLDRGADVNAKDEDGYTASMYAKERGYTEIVELLNGVPTKIF